MKILVVDQTAVLASERGLYRALAAETDLHITLIVPRHWSDDFETQRYEPEPRSPLTVIPSLTLLTGKPHRSLYTRLAPTLRRVRPGILYVNAEPESYLAWSSVKLRDHFSPYTRLVFMTWRNIDFPAGTFPYRFAWLNSAAERLVLERADHCIARNATGVDILKGRGIRNATVIPPAVDTAVFRPGRNKELRARLGLDTFTIGFAGRLAYQKGIDILLHAARKLSFPFKLLLVGDGPESDNLRTLARRLQLEACMVWAGPVAHAEMAGYLGAMDVLVLPSRSERFWKEQFGRILIEAMACGVPVVGSRSGEIPDVIGNAGLLFEEGSSERLAKILRRVRQEPKLRQAMRQKGLARVKSQFSVGVIARKYALLFRKLNSGRLS